MIHPRLGSKEALGDGIERTIGGYIASKPTGAEQLIVIVSKAFVDFGFYESMAEWPPAAAPNPPSNAS